MLKILFSNIYIEDIWGGISYEQLKPKAALNPTRVTVQKTIPYPNPINTLLNQPMSPFKPNPLSSLVLGHLGKYVKCRGAHGSGLPEPCLGPANLVGLGPYV